MNKAIVVIRLRPHCAIPPTSSRPIGRIAYAQKFSDLPGITNDSFCCMTLFAIEWSFLQRKPQRRCIDYCSEDCQCFWMAREIPENFPFPLGDRVHHLTHGTLGPPESSLQMASRSVQNFCMGSKCHAVQCIVNGMKTPKLPLMKTPQNCPFP